MSEAVDLREYQRQAAEATGRGKWPAECWASEMRFGHRAARSYPLIDVPDAVQTPHGPGTLIQVIGGMGRVVLITARPEASYRDGKTFRPTTNVRIEDIEPSFARTA